VERKERKERKESEIRLKYEMGEILIIITKIEGGKENRKKNNRETSSCKNKINKKRK
jgi:hypothetical protein